MKRINIRRRKTAILTKRSRRFGFVLSILSVGMILFLTPRVTPVTKATRARLSGAGPKSSAPICSACAQASTQTIYAPLIELPESSGTEINLNCRSPQALEITPTFYTKKGEGFTGEVFEMGPAEVKTGTPCPPHFDHGLTDPEPITVPVGDSAGQSVLEVDVDVYNNEYGPYGATVDDEWSWDTSIATLYSGTVTGISAGSTGTTVTIEYPLYVYWEGDCWAYGTNQTNVNGQAQSRAEVHISSVTPTGTMSAQDGGTFTVTIQVAAGPGIASNVTVTVALLLDSKSNPSITVAQTKDQSGQATTSQTVAVHSNNPGSVSFVVGTASGNQASGTLTYKAYITGVSSEAVTFSAASAGSSVVTVP